MTVRLLTIAEPIVDSSYVEIPMTEDSRCCGTGTCLINEDGLCWCGQSWDGEKMCFQKTADLGNNADQISTKTEPVIDKTD
jgi:hypothetical protein